MDIDIYRETILDAAKHPHNYGKLEGADTSTQQLNPSCGDDVTVYLRFDQDQQHVVDVAWEGHGCVMSKAAMSLLSDHLKNMSVADIKKLDRPDLEALLGVQALSPGREKCVMIGLQAVHKALDSIQQSTKPNSINS